MKTTMESNKNFKLLRETLHSVNPPCIPYLGNTLN